MKRIIAFIIGISFLISLMSSCSQTGTTSSNSNNITSKTIKTDSGYELPGISLKEKKITILEYDKGWVYNSGKRDASFKESDGGATDTFEKYYGGQVEVIHVSPDEINTILSTKLLSNEPVDLVRMISGFPSLIIQNLVQPVDGLLDFNYVPMKSLKAAYESYALDGKHYVMPFLAAPAGVIAYNKQIFTDNDLKTPRQLFKDGSWTWDKLKEYAVTLQNDPQKTGNPERWGLASTLWTDCHNALYGTGKNIVRFENNEIVSNLNDPDIKKNISFYADLFIKEKVASPNRSLQSVKELLDSGRAAMGLIPGYVASRDHLPTLANSGNLETAPIPKYSGSAEHSVFGNVLGYYIAKGSTNLDAAKAFVYSFASAVYDSETPDTPRYALHKKVALADPKNKLTAEQYDERKKNNAELNKVNALPDNFRDFLDIETLFVYLLGGNGVPPISYEQAVQIVEPPMKQKIDALKNFKKSQ